MLWDISKYHCLLGLNNILLNPFCLYIHLLINLGVVLLFLAIVKNAAMNINVQVSV